MDKVVRSVLFGQLFFIGGLLVCVILKPEGLAANDGISYYGIYERTFFPYAVGLLGSAYFLARAASSVMSPALRPLRLSFRTYVPLVVGIVFTPYAAGRYMDYLHTVCGSALFSLQLILSGWLIWQLRYAWWAVALTVMECIAGVLSAVFLRPPHGFLIQSQVVFQLAFGALVLLGLRRLRAST